MIYIYKFLSLIFIPLIKLNLRYRIIQKKECAARHKERYGIGLINEKNLKKTKEVIWIHSASIGEFKSSKFLIEKFHKDFTLVITTTTLSAARYAKEKYGDKIIHQFAPLDVSFWVKRFLKNWNPKLIIWIESDLWPITLHMIKQKKIPAILLNLRLSPKSYNNWKIIPSFYNNLLQCFAEVFAQSKIDQKRIKKLSDKDIKFTGNLKLTDQNIDLKKIKSSNSADEMKIIRIMLCSTHEQEEEKLLPIFRSLVDKYKNIRLVIAPRHPERADKIMSLCFKNKFLSVLENQQELNTNKVIIVNSLGILEKYFLISDIVLLGGSFISAGGHNPIEPAIYNCAIITGPEIFNWQDIFEDMINDESCLKAKNIMELKHQIIDLIDNKSQIKIMKSKAYNFSQKKIIDTYPIEKIINKFLNLEIC